MSGAAPPLYKRRTVCIDSNDRVNPTSSTPSQYRVLFPNISNVKMVQLVRTEVPNTEYVFNASNNKIDFSTAPGITVTATIPPGSYSGSEMADEINTQLNRMMLVPANTDFVATYNSTTSTFEVSRLLGATFKFLWGTGPSSPGRGNTSAASPLGFDDVDTPAFVVSIASTRHCRLAGEDYVYMCIRGMPTVLTSSGLGDVFARIVWNQPPKTICFDSFSSSPYIFTPPRTSFSELEVEFRKRNGALYDFNGVNHSYTLEVFSEQ